jgi:hypothetical protein
MQHFLKPAAGAAGAKVIAAKLLDQLLLTTVDRPIAPLHASLAQGTPGDASTSAQKQDRASVVFFFAIRNSLRREIQFSLAWKFVAA